MPTDFSKKIIFVTVLTLSTYVFVFTQNAAAGNSGYIDKSAVPETKKDTVIIREDSDSKGIVRNKNKAPEFTEMQLMARNYRQQGLDAQQRGDLDAAIDFYSKASQYDPSYAVVFNDLGVIFEATGDMERAEQDYQQAVKIDPNFVSAYTNLALLYENKRDLVSASRYWKKRADLGRQDDPWTQKAKQRFQDIQMILGHVSVDNKEQQIVGLIKDVTVQKSILKKDDKALTKSHFDKAKNYYQQNNYDMALKEAMDAMQLEPSNQEIEKFISKVHVRMISQ